MSDGTNPQDWVDVADVLARYGQALDDKDWAMLSSCFVPDATFDYAGSGRYNNYADFEELARVTLGRYSSTQHLVGSIRITIDGDIGEAHCYAQAAHVMDGIGDMRITGTSYYDTLRRTPDGWRIVSRRLVRLWGDGPQR
jgi:3-phenylpropionate/cinnamic acid dioxygenase small subunit